MSSAQRAVLGGLAVFPTLAVATYFLVGDVEALSAPVWSLSQPREEYILMAIAVKGLLFAGCACGALGIARAWPALAYVGIALLAIGGFLLIFGGSGIIVWLSAFMVFMAMRAARVR